MSMMQNSVAFVYENKYNAYLTSGTMGRTPVPVSSSSDRSQCLFRTTCLIIKWISGDNIGCASLTRFDLFMRYTQKWIILQIPKIPRIPGGESIGRQTCRDQNIDTILKQFFFFNNGVLYYFFQSTDSFCVDASRYDECVHACYVYMVQNLILKVLLITDDPISTMVWFCEKLTKNPLFKRPFYKYFRIDKWRRIFQDKIQANGKICYWVRYLIYQFILFAKFVAFLGKGSLRNRPN